MPSIEYIDHKKVSILLIDLTNYSSEYELNDLFSRLYQLLKINRNDPRVLYKLTNIEITDYIIAKISFILNKFKDKVIKRAFLINNRKHELLIDYLSKKYNILKNTKVFNNIIDAYNYLENDRKYKKPQ